MHTSPATATALSEHIKHTEAETQSKKRGAGEQGDIRVVELSDGQTGGRRTDSERDRECCTLTGAALKKYSSWSFSRTSSPPFNRV